MVSGIQIIGIIFALAQSYFTFLHYKRKEFTIRECAGWLFIWLMFAVVTLFPGEFRILAGNFGAFRPLDFFTVVGFLVVLSISFYTYINVDRLRKRLEVAVRELALNDVTKK